MNPRGELLLGIKVENKRALANAESTMKVPGVSFAEWGLGDMGWSLGYSNAPNLPFPEEMQAARTRVVDICKDSGVFFKEDLVGEKNIVSMIEDGIMMTTLRDDGAAARVGRTYTRLTS